MIAVNDNCLSVHMGMWVRQSGKNVNSSFKSLLFGEENHACDTSIDQKVVICFQFMCVNIAFYLNVRSFQFFVWFFCFTDPANK